MPFGQSPFTSTRTDGRSTVSTGDKLSHIHPSIRAALKEYHEKFAGRVMIQRLLDHANITLQDLPFLTPLVDSQSGKNWLCYNHCLGICQHGRQCLFRRRNGHVDGAALPQDFVRTLLDKLKPGVDFMLRAEYPAKGAALSKRQPAAVSSDGGHATKRQRQEE